MKTSSGHMSIAEVRDQMANKVLTANRAYQRGAGLWPVSAKSYFMDTIMNEYPFQSVYIHEYISRDTKVVRKDIVDGQQRLTTIFDFLNDEFALGRSSREHFGRSFGSLDDDIQHRVLGYSVPVITITRSNTDEILEMFRRMNAFTVPLNPSEKRHSQFHGQFKWFINSLADEFSPMFNSFDILTQKQIVRMSDAELITDFADIIARGIQNRQPAAFHQLYRNNDETFALEDEYQQKIGESLSYIRSNFGEIARGFASRSYVVYSLVAALIHNRWGITNGQADLGAAASNSFTASAKKALANILVLASAHESKDLDGPYAEYVSGCLSTTHRYAQRKARTKWLLKALRDEM